MIYLKDKANWVKVPQMVGFQEIITINEIGEVVAKLDTGNGATCSIHAEDININKEKKEVSFVIGDKKLKMPYVRKIVLKKGGIAAIDVHRVTINFDIRFNGSILKNVEFALDDRTGKSSPVLMSRGFMARANIIVNPAKSFMVTINPFENVDKHKEIKLKDRTIEEPVEEKLSNVKSLSSGQED
jgi:hypothetical protein